MQTIRLTKRGRVLALPGLLLFLLTPCIARAAVDTWDGGSTVNDNITTNNNWADNTAPLSDILNTDLIFAGTTRLTPNVLTPFSAKSISFGSTAGAFVFGGQVLNVGVGGIGNGDAETMTFNNPVSFAGTADTFMNA